MMNQPGPSQGYAKLAWDAEHRGDLDTAAYWYQEHIREVQQNGQTFHELLATSNLAEMFVRSGQFQRAIETATRLLARSRQEKQELFEMRASGRLVEALIALDPRGRWPEIRTLLERGLLIARQGRINYWEIYILVLMGTCLLELSDFKASLARLQEANSLIFPNTDDRYHLQAYTWYAMARLMLKQEITVEAKQHAGQAVAIAQMAGVLDYVARAELVLARAERAVNERAEALRLTQQVIGQAEKFNWRGIEQEAFLIQAILKRELGLLTEAESSVNRALSLAHDLQMKDMQLQTMLVLVEILFDKQEKRERLNSLLGEIESLSKEWHYPDYGPKIDELRQRT
jgi:tetratricopeptide (TPR) repeat protein